MTQITGSYSYSSVIAAIAKVLTATPQIEMTIARQAKVAFEDVYPAVRRMVEGGQAVEGVNADGDLVYKAA